MALVGTSLEWQTRSILKFELPKSREKRSAIAHRPQGDLISIVSQSAGALEKSEKFKFVAAIFSPDQPLPL